MGDFRIRYGMALGPEGTVAHTSAGHLLPIDDTTPDVSQNVFWLTQNTGATTITHLDYQAAGGLVSTPEGKLVVIRFGDNLTTIANAGQMYLSGTGAAFTTGQTITFVHFNSAWYELSRSQLGREAVKTVTVAGASLAPNVAGVDVLLVNNTAASTVLGLSGGVIGQRLVVAKAIASAGTSLTLQGAANLMLAGTTAFVVNDSAAYSFVCDNGTRFRQIGGPITP